MGGVFKIKLCRHLDPTEFQKRFWSDFAPIFEPFRDQFVAIWAPPEPSWARPGGASSPLWHQLGAKGCRRARFQFQRAHFEPPWTPKGANLTPKGTQMSSRLASKTPLNIAWSPISIIRPFVINFGHMLA